MHVFEIAYAPEKGSGLPVGEDEDKGIYRKVTQTWYFTSLPRSRQWIDFYKIWLEAYLPDAIIYSKIMLYKLVKEFWFCERSNCAISRSEARSPLTRCSRDGRSSDDDQLMGLNSVDVSTEADGKQSLIQNYLLTSHRREGNSSRVKRHRNYILVISILAACEIMQ